MAKDARDIAYRARVDRYERRHERGLRRLERRLDAVREIEEKRSRQAEKARQRGAARKVQSKRARQAEEARQRRAAIEAAIAGLQAAAEAAAAGALDAVDDHAPEATVAGLPLPATPEAEPAPAEAELVEAVPAPAGPRGYCLRERRSVELSDAQPAVLRNGRAGIAGTCPGCGTRIVRPGRL